MEPNLIPQHSAGEKSGSAQTHSGIEEKKLRLVCFSLNQSPSWVAQSPRYATVPLQNSVGGKLVSEEDLDVWKRALALKCLNPQQRKTPQKPKDNVCRLCRTTFMDKRNKHNLITGALQVKPSYAFALEELSELVKTVTRRVEGLGNAGLLSRHRLSRRRSDPHRAHPAGQTRKGLNTDC